MDFRDLVVSTRSYRRFDQSKKISWEQLKELVRLAGLTPSAANLQPLVYRIVLDEKICDDVYDTLSWASALPDWKGPLKGERPTAYIVIAQDMNISKRVWLDSGISAVTIMYGAVDMGFGGCIIASIDKERLNEILQLTTRYAIQLVLALGVPNEKVTIDVLKNPHDSTAYYRTEQGEHIVPKRNLRDILI